MAVHDPQCRRHRICGGDLNGSSLGKWQRIVGRRIGVRCSIPLFEMCSEEASMKSVLIEKRFCGPPTSANGGYVCGLLATHIDGNAEITLRAPPPLLQRLAIVISEHGVE